MRNLHLGCGLNKIAEFINIDMNPAVNPDVVRDIEKGLPYDDNSVDEVLCNQILEHIHDLVFVMNEIHRVLKPKKRVLISVPLLSAKWALIDPTHVRFFNMDSFDFFTVRDYNSETAGVKGWFKVVSKLEREGSLYLTLEAMK